MTDDHPSDEILQAFVAGKLEVVMADQIAEHVEKCGTCSNKAFVTLPDLGELPVWLTSVRREWHLLVPNSFGHIAFGFVSRFDKGEVLLGVSFSSSVLKAIRSVSHTVSSDGVEQLLVELFAKHSVLAALHGNYRLKRLQGLNRSCEADRPRLQSMLGRGLSDNCAEEIEGQDVGPDLFAYGLRGSAAQDVHLQSQAHYDGIVAFSQTDFTEDLKKITIPTLIMHGDNDQIVPYADSAPLTAKLVRNAILKTYQGFPHGMPTTHPDQINADLFDFIWS